jgi:hypothetical protein
MANKPQPFRQHHITRALRAYAAAGRPEATVEVRLPSGATITVGSRPDAASPKAGKAQVSSSRGGKSP